MQTCLIEGTKFNDLTIDGQGQFLTSDNNKVKDSITVRSIKDKNGNWLVPENITIKNFKIKGSIRICGLGVNGEAELVRQSSYNKDHTEYCQKAAPRNITFENLQIEAEHRIPFYVSPGCTNITLKNCTFKGYSVATTVYMCCESRDNKILNNVFKTRTNREVIAVDGSAYNLIDSNIFEYLDKGGIYVYRNSGEGGTVRHQTPSYNKIINNTFNIKNDIISKLKRIIFPTVWFGSRSYFIQYFIKFRNDDKGYPFGSSINNSDCASNNIVKDNKPKNIYIRDWQA